MSINDNLVEHINKVKCLAVILDFKLPLLRTGYHTIHKTKSVKVGLANKEISIVERRRFCPAQTVKTKLNFRVKPVWVLRKSLIYLHFYEAGFFSRLNLKHFC